MNSPSSILRYTLAAAALLLWTPPATAQDGAFAATIDRTKVGTGEQFTVTFTISGADAMGAQNFKAPDFGQLLVLSGPNTSQSYQIINGSMSGSIAYSFILYARQTGKYSIGSATIDYKGKQLKTQPIQVEVVQGKPQQTQQNPETNIANIGDNLFIRATADKQRSRLGEQITVTYKLYTRVSVSGYDLTKAPTYEGFWSEDIEQSQQPAVVNEMFEGKQYRVAVIKRTALFATQPGTLKIAPLEVRCAVQVQSRRKSNDPFDIFNDPFFQQTQTQQLDFKSNPLTFRIDPLPPNPPPGFLGAVGKYAFAASVDKREVQAGDPITLRISVSGTGNISLLTLPKPVLPSDLEAYEPKITNDVTRSGGIIGGKKTAEYLLVPRNPGKRTIDAIPFVYYDLGKNEYVRLSSSKFDLTISPGREIAGGNAAMASKEDIKLLGEDIRYLKLTPGDLRTLSESPLNSETFYLFMVLPPFAFIGAFVYRRRMRAIYGDMPKFRFQQAGKEASRRLKQAKRLLAQGNTEQYHAEISRALLGYLEDKLHIAKSSLSVEDAAGKLVLNGVGEKTIAELKACVERADFIRFAPSADTTVARKELLDSARSTIDAIEKEFGHKS
ncbi:MAG TPA: BatD family protein [Bacteroidota bacterium]